MSDRILQTAFPLVYDDVTKSSREVHLGMSLRDYFAAQLIATVLKGHSKPLENIDHAATVSYQVADAMLKARQA